MSPPGSVERDEGGRAPPTVRILRISHSFRYRPGATSSGKIHNLTSPAPIPAITRAPGMTAMAEHQR
jgi:hypothetical protein